ncbi:unnamed protein product [Schistosoma mattheei]|uniref:Uncharacterized protein n=1 Tax=Schistosoma mattheei TaxID=31246 RepID=A0A183NZR8_9TREM|nr:unnamed protein product [Schistosoma mattheei]
MVTKSRKEDQWLEPRRVGADTHCTNARFITATRSLLSKGFSNPTMVITVQPLPGALKLVPLHQSRSLDKSRSLQSRHRNPMRPAESSPTRAQSTVIFIQDVLRFATYIFSHRDSLCRLLDSAIQGSD